MLKTLGALMQKYPLCIPYVLEKRVACPQIGLLKTEGHELAFADYVLVVSALTQNSLHGFVHLLCEVPHTFAKQSPSVSFTSAEYYARALFDRALLWLKKLAERADFFERETNLAIFASVTLILEYLLTKRL